MKIIELKVLRGPNYWSVRRPNLIQMKLDLEELAAQFPCSEMIAVHFLTSEFQGLRLFCPTDNLLS